MRRKKHRAVPTLSVLLLFVLILGAFPIAAQVASNSHSVAANGLVRGQARLADGTNPFLSGVGDNTISVAATVEPTPPPAGPFVGGSGTVYYTVDGTEPTTSSPSYALTTADVVPAGGPATYAGTLAATAFQGLPDGTVLRYFFVVCVSNASDAQTCSTNNNGGAFYSYRLDVKRPQVQMFTVPSIVGSSVPYGVTASSTPPISFTVQDPLGGSLLRASTRHSVLINNENRTADFTVLHVNGRTASFTFAYPEGYSFEEGEVVLSLDVQDRTRNTPSDRRFFVDQTMPEYGDFNATPSVAETIGGVRVTSLGSPITLRANVTDPHLDTNAPSVRARFVNASRDLQSDYFGLTYDPAAFEWRTDSAAVPATFPVESYRLAVEFQATDLAGNLNTVITADDISIDPSAPVIVDEVLDGFQRGQAVTVKANVTDVGVGLAQDGVVLNFLNVQGEFAGPVTGFNAASGLYEVPMQAFGDLYVGQIPAGNDTAVVNYFVKATDRAGNTFEAALRNYTVDAAGPVIDEGEFERGFRGAPPLTFTAHVEDAGAGLDEETMSLHYRIGSGSFEDVPMIHDDALGIPDEAFNVTHGATHVYTVSVNPGDHGFPSNHGDVIQYYLQAEDVIGNVGRLGGPADVRTSVIDLNPPTFSLTAPATAQGPTFQVDWDGTDDLSGVASFTVEARFVRGGVALSDWVQIAENTTDMSMTVCVEAGYSYDFRGFATDRAGNSGQLSSTPLATTAVTGSSCPDGVDVTVVAPKAGDVLDLDAGRGPLDVRWTATSLRTLVPPKALAIEISFSPDNGSSWFVLASDVFNDGRMNLPGTLPDCSFCLVRVRATTPAGVSGEAISGSFAIRNGFADADLDGNSLRDAWEVRYYGRVGVANADGDEDRDGLKNVLESQAGTDPRERDTDGDGGWDKTEIEVGTDPLDPQSTPTKAQARHQQFTPVYWTIPVVFAAVGVLFFLGLARRW